METEKIIYQIVVSSQIEDSEGDVNEITLYTEATYKRVQLKGYLMYDESEVSGMDKTKTLVSYDGNLVKIQRFGESKSLLKIEKDVDHENMYETPYGIFMMKTTGTQILWDDSSGIEIKLAYILEIEGGKSEATKVSIQIHSKRE